MPQVICHACSFFKKTKKKKKEEEEEGLGLLEPIDPQQGYQSSTSPFATWGSRQSEGISKTQDGDALI